MYKIKALPFELLVAAGLSILAILSGSATVISLAVIFWAFKIFKDWKVGATGLSILAIYSGSETAITLAVIFWASICFGLVSRHFSQGRYRKYTNRCFVLYHATLAAFVATSVNAQVEDTVCPTTGIFGSLGSFITTTFTETTFGLSSLFCQVIGFLTFALIVGFISMGAYASFQIGHHKQPISTVIDPFIGFVIFVALSSGVLAVMLGTVPAA